MNRYFSLLGPRSVQHRGTLTVLLSTIDPVKVDREVELVGVATYEEFLCMKSGLNGASARELKFDVSFLKCFC